MGFTLLKDLNSAQKHSKIKVRISRIWEAKTPQLKNDFLSLECLLIDEEGYTMQASIRKYDAEYFRTLIAEGYVYSIENFNLTSTRNNYVVVCQKHIIQFSKWTRVAKVTENVDQFPLYSFSFVQYEYIMTKKQTIPYLIDVIGTVVAAASLSHTYVAQQQTPIKKLQLQDEEKKTLSITLWDEFAIDFENQLQMYEKNVEPVVVIFASMTVRSYRDEIYLSTCSASRVYINLDIPKVAEFRSTIDTKQVSLSPIKHIEVSDQPILSPQELMSKNRMNIADLLTLDASPLQDVKYTCKAKLVDIDTTYGWWYKACSKCRSAVKDYDETSTCGHCGATDLGIVPWYKLDAVVRDETASTNFMIFGKLAQELIHIPAQQLAISTNTDRYVLPAVIKKIIDRTYIFQISVDSRRKNISSQSFTVSKIFAIEETGKEKTQTYKKESYDIGEEPGENLIGNKSQDDTVEEITEELVVQSSSSQSTSQTKESQKRKRSFRLIHDSTSDEEGP